MEKMTTCQAQTNRASALYLSYTRALEKRNVSGYNKKMDLSIVIPAFEEGGKIAADVQAAAMFLESNHLTGEIIVVDDGSDDNTATAAKSVEVPIETALRVIRYEPHRGKGFAVRTGIKQTSGEYVMFADAGSCVPYENILRGLSLLKSGTCDIAHGSRKLRQTRILKKQSCFRRICALIFRWFVSNIIGIGREFTDTQCGFKIYRGEVARRLYAQCVTDGFMFDVEVVMLDKKLGYTIREFPIDWTCDRDSRLSPTRSLWRVLRELITIKCLLAKRKKQAAQQDRKAAKRPHN